MSEVDFEAVMAAKLGPEEGEPAEVAGPEATPEPEGEAVEPAASGRPRDAQGRFLSAEDRPAWLPPQFKDEESFARSFHEAQALIGRQGQEMGELRKLVEGISERTPQPQSIGQMQSALEENPQAVAYWAAEQGNEQVLDLALAAWTQQALDEGDAAALRDAQRFERDVEFAKMKYEFSQEVVPAIEGVQREAGVRALSLAKRELSAKYPDFDEVLESVANGTGEEIAGLDPQVIRQLQATDPKAALELVYRYVVGGKQALQDASSEAAKTESLERKRQATVATSSASPATRAETPIEQFKKYLLEPEAHSVHHGLTK